YNLKSEKQLSYQDIPHIVVLSYLYEPPVGPGKKYLSHGVASKVLGGWQIGGVLRYQSGSPAAINQFATANPYSTGNYRFSVIGGQPLFGSGKWSPAAEVSGLTITGASNGAANFSGGWNSGCHENGSGVFQPNTAQPTIANCNAYLDPSAAGLA